jgi:hypothetical protein
MTESRIVTTRMWLKYVSEIDGSIPDPMRVQMAVMMVRIAVAKPQPRWRQQIPRAVVEFLSKKQRAPQREQNKNSASHRNPCRIYEREQRLGTVGRAETPDAINPNRNAGAIGSPLARK